MAGSRKAIEYRDFTGGEWGQLQPWLAEKNQFTGNNMIVYRTGELGPRPGARRVPTGSLTGTIVATFDDADNLGIAQGNQLKSLQLPVGGTPATRSGTFSENPPGSWDIYQFGTTWYISTGGAVYKYNGASITSLNGADGQWLMLHGERLILGNLGTSGSNPGTIRYSDAPASGEFTAWDAGNLIIVGDSRSPVYELFELRNNLVIVKQEGTFMLSGVPGVNETLRRVLHGIPITAHQDNMERIWGINTHKSPSYYNGAQEVRYDQIGLFASNSSAGSTEDIIGTTYLDTTEQGGQFFLLSGSSNPASPTAARALINHRGVWTQHTFNLTLDAFQNGIPGARLLSSHRAEFMVDPTVSFSDLQDFHANVRQGGAVSLTTLGNPPNFYVVMPCLDRPGFEITTDANNEDYVYERAGDDSSEQIAGSFSLREEHESNGNEVRVRGLVVDFRKWNTGGSLTNHFDAYIDTLRPYDGLPPYTSETLSWDEPGSAASAAGTLQRVHFSVGDTVQGGGFQVHFQNVRGIAIQRVQVLVDTYETRL